jgi:hypothetical protein
VEALWMAVGAAVTAATAALINLMTARHKLRKEQRSDTLTEWREFAEHQQRQIDEQHHRIGELNAEVMRLHEAHAQCQAANAELRGRFASSRPACGGCSGWPGLGPC